jgi:hypothetical protein
MTLIKLSGYRKLCLLFIFSLILNYCNAQSCADILLGNKADSLFKAKDYAIARNYYLKLIKTKYLKRVSYYYLAVCYGNLNLADSACHYLSIAAKKGLKYGAVEYFEEDMNLDPLRGAANWSIIEKKIIQNTLNAQKSIDTVLLEALKIRKDLDQKYRKLMLTLTTREVDSVSQIQKEIDLDNQRWLKQIIKKKGWPTISKVGREGEHIAWLIVQHAEHRVCFQKKCLRRMYALIDKGEIDLKNLAYLKDRVLVNQGKKQMYGTQFLKIKIDGKYVLKSKPIENIDCVNLRRSYMTLPSLEYYLKSASKRYITNKY